MHKTIQTFTVHTEWGMVSGCMWNTICACFVWIHSSEVYFDDEIRCPWIQRRVIEHDAWVLKVTLYGDVIERDSVDMATHPLGKGTVPIGKGNVPISIYMSL